MRIINELRYDKQAIGLEGVPNARQLGSYISRDGRRIKHGVLIRCGVLNKATDSDLKLLKEKYHVNYVFDLRTAYEVNRWPDRIIEDATYVNMPIQDDNNNFWQLILEAPGNTAEEKLINFAMNPKANPMMKQLYVSMVSDEYCQLQYAALLDRILRSEGTMLWHCTQGKDRTGLATAFLLAALGFDRKTIVDDFALTNVPYQPNIDRLSLKLKLRGANQDAFEAIQAEEGVSIKNFEAALDYIDQNYGSMENYIKEIFVLTDDELDTLKDKFLE
ncbi:MAG: tyrosine-protein phosphatase [Bacteroidales bacterium]|nr:tyrosine-protein phosphatase [Bacteroidales bacterium]